MRSPCSTMGRTQEKVFGHGMVLAQTTRSRILGLTGSHQSSAEESVRYQGGNKNQTQVDGHALLSLLLTSTSH